MPKRIHPEGVIRYVSPTELEQIVRRAEQQAYERGFIDGHNRAAVTLMKYRDILEQINLSLAHIDTLWTVRPLPLKWLKKIAMPGLDLKLHGQWRALFDLILRMDPAPPFEQVSRFRNVVERYELAIQIFNAGQDKTGEAIREIADSKPGRDHIRELREFSETLALGGRPSGMQSWRRHFGELIIEMERRSPDDSPDRIGAIIRARLEAIEHPTPDETEILERLKLTKYQDPAQRARLIRDTKQDYLNEFGDL